MTLDVNLNLMILQVILLHSCRHITEILHTVVRDCLKELDYCPNGSSLSAISRRPGLTESSKASPGIGADDSVVVMSWANRNGPVVGMP